MAETPFRGRSSPGQFAAERFVARPQLDVTSLFAAIEAKTSRLRFSSYEMHDNAFVVEQRGHLCVHMLCDVVSQSRCYAGNESFEVADRSPDIARGSDELCDFVDGVISEIMKILLDLHAHGLNRTSCSDHEGSCAGVPDSRDECRATRESSEGSVQRPEMACCQSVCNQTTARTQLRSHARIPQPQPHRRDHGTDRTDCRKSVPDHFRSACRAFRDELDQCHV